MLRVKKLIGFHLSRNQAQSVILSSQQTQAVLKMKRRNEKLVGSTIASLNEKWIRQVRLGVEYGLGCPH